MGPNIWMTSVIFQANAPTEEEIEELMETGIRRFVFLGPDASKWLDVFIDVMALRRESGRSVPDAQSMIFTDESLEDTIELIRGVTECDGRAGILVL